MGAAGHLALCVRQGCTSRLAIISALLIASARRKFASGTGPGFFFFMFFYPPAQHQHLMLTQDAMKDSDTFWNYHSFFFFSCRNDVCGIRSLGSLSLGFVGVSRTDPILTHVQHRDLKLKWWPREEIAQISFIKQD